MKLKELKGKLRNPSYVLIAIISLVTPLIAIPIIAFTDMKDGISFNFREYLHLFLLGYISTAFVLAISKWMRDKGIIKDSDLPDKRNREL